MASNGRECKVINCGFGNDPVIVCASHWLWVGGTAWACLFGRHVMSKTGNTGGNLYHAASGTYVSVFPVKSPIGKRIAETGEEPAPYKTFLQKYWLLLMAAGVIAYFYFKKK